MSKIGTVLGDHGERVKHAVYRPDWTDPRRAEYTLALAARLAQLAPATVDVPTPDGFYSLYLPEQRELWMRMFFATNFPGPLGDFLGISRISTNVFDWQTRPSARPLATIGARPVFADHADTIRALMNTNFNPEQVVYLPCEAASSISLTNRSSAQVLASSFSSSAVNVRTSAAEPALLVVAQSYYHRWKAYNVRINPRISERASYSKGKSSTGGIASLTPG